MASGDAGMVDVQKEGESEAADSGREKQGDENLVSQEIKIVIPLFTTKRIMNKNSRI